MGRGCLRVAWTPMAMDIARAERVVASGMDTTEGGAHQLIITGVDVTLCSAQQCTLCFEKLIFIFFFF
jgi:hypothetical protein